MDKPIGFTSERAAREYAREHYKDTELVIVASFAAGDIKLRTHWIDEPGSMLRSWEQVVFAGKGIKAMTGGDK